MESKACEDLSSSSSSSSSSSLSSSSPTITGIIPALPRATRGGARLSFASAVLCCCECGLMTDSVVPCQGCNNSLRGKMRPECAAKYRRCHHCPKVKVGGGIRMVEGEEVKVVAIEAMVTRRLLEPTPEDQNFFLTNVLHVLLQPCWGKNMGQCRALMKTYGSDNERSMHPASTLMEMTLPDYNVAVIGEILMKDIRSLRYWVTPAQAVLAWWLNDAVLNEYLKLVNATASELGVMSHCFNSFFLLRLKSSYKDVKRWSVAACAKRGIKSVFELERLLVAINISNSHWTFMVAHMRDKKIGYHDSMLSDQETSMDHMASFHRKVSSLAVITPLIFW